jgi:hypothetical protein
MINEMTLNPSVNSIIHDQTNASYFTDKEDPMNSTPTFPYGFPPYQYKDEEKLDSWKTIASGILKKFDDKH